MLVFPNFI